MARGTGAPDGRRKFRDASRNMPWMVAIAQQGREHDCRRSLKEEIGVVCYMPVYRDFVVKAGKKVWKDCLLLGSYFFVRHSPSLEPGRILASRLVRGMFMEPDSPKPALVRDAEIDELRSREDRHGYVSKAGRRTFKKDQSVVPQVGVFAGHEARFVRVGRGECDVAVIAMFGSEAEVEFAPGVLRAADTATRRI